VLSNSASLAFGMGARQRSWGLAWTRVRPPSERICGSPCKPAKTFFTNPCARNWNHLLKCGEDWGELETCHGQLREPLWGPKHVVSIPGDPGPPEKADLIDDISRVGTIGSQIVSNWCAAGREQSA